jgi:hypothetical protein
MPKNIECICVNCGGHFLKSSKEYNRRIKLNKSLYCSLSCAGVANQDSLGEYKGKTLQIPIDVVKRKKDKFSDLRVFARLARRRDTEQDLTLEYLKDLWEQQNGICPLTGWVLSLERKAKPNQASLDRIDSNKGYIQGNVRYIALIANLCKWTFDDEQLIHFCKSVVSTRCL